MVLYIYRKGGNINMNIWFDMDGTLVDLYGIPNWLEYIQSENPAPYLYAKPLLKLAPLARMLNKLIRKGHTINIISWTAKNGSPQYNSEVAATKIKWLEQHLKSVHFTHIDIVEYGTPKYCQRDGILFDDELPNRQTWNGTAYNKSQIMEILKSL